MSDVCILYRAESQVKSCKHHCEHKQSHVQSANWEFLVDTKVNLKGLFFEISIGLLEIKC